MRKLCQICKQRPVAINYHKEGRTFYRSKCDHCDKDRKLGIARWQLAGYNKKNICDRCGFKSSHTDVFNVFYIDGNLDNNRHANLKTVCANCQQVLYKEGIRWRQGDLTPDL
jgi:hypothetical protein